MSETKLTVPMRGVLKRMEKGESLRCDFPNSVFKDWFRLGGFHFGSWGEFSRPETVYKSTVRGLIKRKLISKDRSGYWYTITLTGRKALKEPQP